MSDRKLPDDHIARQLYAALACSVKYITADETDTWEDLDEDAQANFLALALTASSAYQDLLEDLGARIIPPGTIITPKSDAEARAMINAGNTFLAQPEHARLRRQSLISGPKLILPPTPHGNDLL